MVYNDTSAKNGLLQFCELYTNLGDTGISGDSELKAKFTTLLNMALHVAQTIILSSQDEWDYDDINHTDFPILTTDLVASQQDYSLPASEKILKIKRVEVKYGTEWLRAVPLDVNEIEHATDSTTIGQEFSTSQPYYDVQYNSIFLYPIPDAGVTGGLKIWWDREADEFTTSDTTQEPGLDEAFHMYLPITAAVEWLTAVKPDFPSIPLLERRKQELEARMRAHYGKKQKDRVWRLGAANPSEYWEDSTH